MPLNAADSRYEYGKQMEDIVEIDNISDIKMH